MGTKVKKEVMKKLFIIILALTTIHAEPLNIDGLLDIEDMSKTMGNMLSKGLSKGFRQVTNTRTVEEECNREWWKYFQKSNHTISIISTENRKIERVLSAHHINHRLITKQKTRNIDININELRKHSCSQKYFEQLVQKETRIKQEKIKNTTLRGLLEANKIIVKKEPLFIVDKKNIIEKQERTIAKKDLKLQMQ